MDIDAIVVGGGHAGIEAALALSKLQFSTLLITQNLDAVGRLSCNPAVGGLSKGNIVREIDALGGMMGKLIDETMIQFRILNRRRGPAVQAPRAQADKFSYHRLAKETLESQPYLQVFQDTVTDLILDETHSRAAGVKTERGRCIPSRCVVLTTGTFMEGKIFIGNHWASSGRLGEPAAVGLGTRLRELGFRMLRMKTGTPARVRRSSIDLEKLEEQPGDEQMQSFSFSGKLPERPSVSCYIAFTNTRTHQIIQENLHSSPLYGGKITGIGPRYCPSIEDKVVRFPQRDRHQIFVEPEGLGTEEMYLNGISTSLPEDVQEAFIRSIDGFAQAQIMRPGYAVEYDVIDPTQLYPTLETKQIEYLFSAGQTNGTSGYEEAACQGLLAGINAGLKLQGKEPLILSRAQAYAGVLIDDLVTKGTNEPYRMFTSRAEYRLNLRHDSADQRLLERAYQLGMQDEQAVERLREKIQKIDEIKHLLREQKLPGGKTWYQHLKSPEISIQQLFSQNSDLPAYDEAYLRQAELDVKYEGYIKRQDMQVKRFEKLERIRIPRDFDYFSVEGLSAEGREKLHALRPVSVGQASRISGVRNSDVAVLMVRLGR